MVVAVPLKSNESVVGIIEIFSTRTKAFTEAHMAKLHVLAERVTDAVNGVEPAPSAPVAMPELIWADVFVESDCRGSGLYNPRSVMSSLWQRYGICR